MTTKAKGDSVRQRLAVLSKKLEAAYPMQKLDDIYKRLKK